MSKLRVFEGKIMLLQYEATLDMVSFDSDHRFFFFNLQILWGQTRLSDLLMKWWDTTKLEEPESDLYLFLIKITFKLFF